MGYTHGAHAKLKSEIKYEELRNSITKPKKIKKCVKVCKK